MIPPQVFPYHSDYAKQSLRGQDVSQRPLLATDFVKQASSIGNTLLDIGCGNMYKTLPICRDDILMVGVDVSRDLLKQAQSKIHQNKFANCYALQADSGELPFMKETFDVAMAILTFWQAEEVHRVLKRRGLFFIECLGPNDKTRFTQFFGQDEAGWRGANVGKTTDIIQSNFADKLSPFFKINTIYNQSWQTAYTKQGLWDLLCHTVSTVRNFDREADALNFKTACDALLQDDGRIVLTQNRLVITAQAL